MELRYHGDFDGSGIRIAAYVCAKTGAVPWRMSHTDIDAGNRPGVTSEESAEIRRLKAEDASCLTSK